MQAANVSVDVKSVMDTWTLQSGFPIVHVSVFGRQVKLRQERFLPDRSADKTQPPSDYKYVTSCYPLRCAVFYSTAIMLPLFCLSFLPFFISCFLSFRISFSLSVCLPSFLHSFLHSFFLSFLLSFFLSFFLSFLLTYLLSFFLSFLFRHQRLVFNSTFRTNWP